MLRWEKPPALPGSGSWRERLVVPWCARGDEFSGVFRPSLG